MLSDLEAVRGEWELVQSANLSFSLMCDMFLDLASDRVLKVIFSEKSCHKFWIFCLIQLWGL